LRRQKNIVISKPRAGELDCMWRKEKGRVEENKTEQTLIDLTKEK
jgi:hypothetical protein